MANVEARIVKNNKHFEISVDLDEALKVKQGKGDITSALQSPDIYYDLKKGDSASKEDLEKAFGTTNIHEVATQIITKGEVQKTQDFRDAEREKKLKQIIDMLLRNCSDQHGKPYTEDRLRRGMSEISYNIDNRPAEQQMDEILHKLKEVIPIKIEVKKVKLTIPAQFTGQVYGMLNDYKESEEWLPNGNLQTIVAIPSGLAIDFFEKLNSATHGAVQSEDVAD